MRSMRSFGLLLLCFCLALSGTAAAMPISGMSAESMAGATSTNPHCPEMADVGSAPSVDEAGAPAGGMKPDCCKGDACQCVGVHSAFVTVATVLGLRFTPKATTAMSSRSDRYSSPALARLVRPPIS